MTLVSRLAQLEQAATPGPWRGTKAQLGLSENLHINAPATVRWTRNLDDGRRATSFVAECSGHGCNNDEDAELIAAMRNALPECLAALRMQERLEQMREQLELAADERQSNRVFASRIIRETLAALDGAAVTAKEGE